MMMVGMTGAKSVFLVVGLFLLCCAKESVVAFSPAAAARLGTATKSFASTSSLRYRSDADPLQEAEKSLLTKLPKQQQQQQQTQKQESTSSSSSSSLVQSVNYFISRKCNYSCKFCFHTAKTSHHLPLEQAQHGLRLLKEAGTEKINFAGGEPFLHPLLLGELCKTASEELGMAVSIISNGSLITPEWMKYYGEFVDVLGVSVDSFVDETNAKIGRGETTTTTAVTSFSSSSSKNKKNNHVNRMLKVRELCDQQDIKFKLNTVVCKYNWQEDMIQQVQQLDPCRWKVFQVLLLASENTPGSSIDDDNNNEKSLRDARPLVVTEQQFQAFVQRHKPHFSENILIPEDNSVMQNSYLLLDEELRFLDCSNGGKVPGDSILDVGVERALPQAGFDSDMFQQRGGVYQWKRDRNNTGMNINNKNGSG